MLKFRRRAVGFSLIELLVVLLLMGLASGFVMFSLNTDSELQVKRRAAERFSLLAKFAVDEAILSGDTVGLMIRVQRPVLSLVAEPNPPQFFQAQTQFENQDDVQYVYQWRRYRDDQWLPIGNHHPVELFPHGSEAVIEINGELLIWSELATRNQITPSPVVVVYASGETTPMSLLLPVTSAAASWQQVSVSASGRVRWIDASRVDPSLLSSMGPNPW